TQYSICAQILLLSTILLGRRPTGVCPFFMFRVPRSIFSLIIVFSIAPAAFSQSPKVSALRDPTAAQRGLKFANTGRCGEALPLLKRGLPSVRELSLRKSVALAGVRCGMLSNQVNVVIDFLQVLNQYFPTDPEVLYVATHTYSDLSTR